MNLAWLDLYFAPIFIVFVDQILNLRVRGYAGVGKNSKNTKLAKLEFLTFDQNQETATVQSKIVGKLTLKYQIIR